MTFFNLAALTTFVVVVDACGGTRGGLTGLRGTPEATVAVTGRSCASGWTQLVVNGKSYNKCFRAFSFGRLADRDWDDAKRACSEKKSEVGHSVYLASISDKDQNDLTASLMSDGGVYFIGYTREGTCTGCLCSWHWVNRHNTHTYTSWQADEPKEFDCSASMGGTWYTYKCKDDSPADVKGYICSHHL